MYAHLTKVRNGYSLLITNSVRPINGREWIVADKKAAREIAARHNAQPWNF